MMNLSLLSLILFLMSTMPSAYSQGFCSDGAGINVGPSGPLLVSNETTKKVTIERKGGEGCGCSHVSNWMNLCTVLNTMKMRCSPNYYIPLNNRQNLNAQLMVSHVQVM